MFKNSSSIVNHTAWTLFSNILPLFIGLISIPILINLLGEERFGILVIIWMFIGYLNLFDLGFSVATTKFASEYLEQDDSKKINILVWTSSTALMLIGLFVGLMLFLFSETIVFEQIKASVSLQIEANKSLQWLAISIPFVVASNGFKGVLSSYQDFKYLGLLNMPFSISTYIIPAGIALISPNLMYISLGLILMRLLNFWLLLQRCCEKANIKLLHPNVSKEEFLKIISYGGWISVSSIISPLMRTLDRFFIVSLLGASAVTYYSTPFEMVTKLWIIPTAIATVIFPHFSKVTEENLKNSLSIFKKAHIYVILLIFPASLFISCFSKEIMSIWINAEFAAYSKQILSILSVGVFINCVAYIAAHFVQGRGRPDIAAKLHVAEFIAYVAALYFLTLSGGLIAVAWIWVIRVAFDFYALLFYSQRISEELSAFVVQISVACTLAMTLIFIPTTLDELRDRFMYCLVGAIFWGLFIYKHVDKQEVLNFLPSKRVNNV